MELETEGELIKYSAVFARLRWQGAPVVCRSVELGRRRHKSAAGGGGGGEIETGLKREASRDRTGSREQQREQQLTL